MAVTIIIIIIIIFYNRQTKNRGQWCDHCSPRWIRPVCWGDLQRITGGIFSNSPRRMCEWFSFSAWTYQQTDCRANSYHRMSYFTRTGDTFIVLFVCKHWVCLSLSLSSSNHLYDTAEIKGICVCACFLLIHSTKRQSITDYSSTKAFLPLCLRTLACLNLR